jgi:folylpolyglutamate synthase/dihydropteroate synthase
MHATQRQMNKYIKTALRAEHKILLSTLKTKIAAEKAAIITEYKNLVSNKKNELKVELATVRNI